MNLDANPAAKTAAASGVSAALDFAERASLVVLESTSDGVMLLGADWRFLYLNPAAEIWLALTLAEVGSKTLWEVFPGLIGSDFETLYRSVVTQQLPGAITRFYPDHQRWYDVRAYPTPHGLSIYFRDSTETQLAANALKLTQARWQLALESGGLGTWNIDPTAGTLTSDEQFRLIFAGSTAPLTYDEAVAAVHADDRERVICSIEASLNSEKLLPYLEEYRVIHGDGSVHWVLAIGRANLDAASNPLRIESFDGTLADITARKAVEQQLRQAEQQFRMLTDTMPQLAWIAESGTDGHISWFNKSWLDYTGASLEAMQGSGWHQVHHPDHTERVITKFAHHVRHGLDWEDTFPLRGKDGTFRWFLSRMNVMRENSVVASQIFGTNTDITEQREMAARLEQQAAVLAETDRRKNIFLATLSHELRNPLAPIQNSLRVMQQTEDPQQLTRTRLVIERQVAQLVRLVDDLMDISRISHGKLALQTAEVDLATVLASAYETSEPLFSVNQVQLQIAALPDPVIIEADATRLVQVFVSLLNNAAKFTSPGGWVTVDVSSRGSDVAVTVTDTGAGIASGELAGIFEMFNQGTAPLDRAEGGLGIGLSLVRSLVELHGGSVQARSSGPGQGSAFTVVLPVRRLQPSLASLDTGALPLRGTGTRILVVDDNIDSADTLALMLELSGFQTHTVYTGPDAVQAALQYQPDIVCLDIGLPGLNGYQVARAIRLQPAGAAMKLLAVTGWGQDEDIRQAREAGFDHHFVKPVDALQLEQLFSEWSLSGMPEAKTASF